MFALFTLHFILQSVKTTLKRKENNGSNETLYKNQLIESLRRYSLKTQKQSVTQKYLCEKKEENTRYFQIKKLRELFEKEKKCLVANKKITDISSSITEALRYSEYFSSKRFNISFKLNNIIDIVYSNNIPPTIKSKRNVIVVIENDKAKKETKSKVTCPDCLKEEMMREIKQKIRNNMKDMILLIRKKLLRGLEKRKEFIFEETPKPSMLIMDDLIAPFPEMETDPIPVFSFAEDKRQERRKCKTESEQNETSKKSNHSPNPKELFYPWSNDTLLNTDQIETSMDDEKSTYSEIPTCAPQLGREDGFQNVDSFLREAEYTSPENQTKSCFETAKRNNQKKNAMDHNRISINLVPPQNESQNDKHPNVPMETSQWSSPKVTNIVEDVSFSSLDLSNPSVVIIPVLKPKEKGGKRNIIIKLKNVPDYVDVIKIKSIMSSIYNACEVKRYSEYFLKNQPKSSYNSKFDWGKIQRRKIPTMSYSMTCPNKGCKSTQNFLIPTPCLEEPNVKNNRSPNRRSAVKQQSNVSSRKNDWFCDE